MKNWKRVEIAEDDLEVEILDDTSGQKVGKEGRYTKNKWVDDNNSRKGRPSYIKFRR